MYRTEQEKFWAGEFGDEYIDRNNSLEQLADNISFFSDVFKHCHKIQSLIEFGANIGMNIKAIHQLLPFSKISAVEINEKACLELKKIDIGGDIFNESILNIKLDCEYDFAFTKGVLIHVDSNKLENVYERLYRCVKPDGYIMTAEYYSPTPVSIEYRGEKDKLFKRDFAGELMDRYTDLELIDYGFTYHRNSLNDDMNWFLMKKNG
jgi:spore coat polysaccharide biosynthesis protein SpsF